MEKVEVYSAFGNPPKAKKEKPSGPSKATKTGYIPTEERIKGMIAAGQRLYDSRNALYDVPAGSNIPDDQIPLDVTRRKDFGLEDASMIAAQVAASLAEQKKKQNSKKPEVKIPEKAVEPEKAPEQGAKAI